MGEAVANGRKPAVLSQQMEEHGTTEHNPAGESPPQSRSTARHAQTPRAERNVDHRSRPETIPPVSGRLRLALDSSWFPLALAVIFGLLTWQVVSHGPLLGVDRGVHRGIDRAVRNVNSPGFNSFTQWWTDLGMPSVAVPLLALAAIASARRLRSWRPVSAAAFAGLFLFGTVIPGKIIIGRAGPLGQQVVSGGFGWFPSGHTATSAICLGTGAMLLALAYPRWKRTLYSGTAFLCAGVAAGLLWNDYHWLLDVLASGCLTGIALWLTRFLFYRRPRS